MESSLKDLVSRGKLLPLQREAMVRLLESSTFASAPRLRSVLAHLMQALEDGLSDSVTEQSIGQAVFGRAAGYNASEDNIVRVTSRHLRTRLDEYYNTEGAADPLVPAERNQRRVARSRGRVSAVPKSSRELLARFHATPISTLPPIELLLEASGLNGASGSHRMIAARTLRWRSRRCVPISMAAAKGSSFTRLGGVGCRLHG